MNRKKQIKRICAFDPPNTDLVYMALPRDVCITVVISLYRVIGVAVYPIYHYKRYRVVPCKLNLHF